MARVVTTVENHAAPRDATTETPASPRNHPYSTTRPGRVHSSDRLASQGGKIAREACWPAHGLRSHRHSSVRNGWNTGRANHRHVDHCSPGRHQLGSSAGTRRIGHGLRFRAQIIRGSSPHDTNGAGNRRRAENVARPQRRRRPVHPDGHTVPGRHRGR